MDTFSVYLPIDRRQSLARGDDLPDRTSGAAVFADLSGSTPLTEALARSLGRQRGAEELTHHLNGIFGALTAEVHRYGGSVIGFAGDALTAWFDADDGGRACAAALAMQAAMQPYCRLALPGGATATLALKVAVAVGPVRRFLVGDPAIQRLEVLAGGTLDRLASAEHAAQPHEVVVAADVVERLEGRLIVRDWRVTPEGLRLASIMALDPAPAPAPWPPLAAPLSDEQARLWLLPRR